MSFLAASLSTPLFIFEENCRSRPIYRRWIDEHPCWWMKWRGVEQSIKAAAETVTDVTRLTSLLTQATSHPCVYVGVLLRTNRRGGAVSSTIHLPFGGMSTQKYPPPLLFLPIWPAQQSWSFGLVGAATGKHSRRLLVVLTTVPLSLSVSN